MPSLPSLSDFVCCTVGFYAGRYAYRVIANRRERQSINNELRSQVAAYTA